MNSNKNFQSTFSRLQASQQTIEEILKMTQNKDVLERRTVVKRTFGFIAIAMAACLLISVAIAAVAGGGLISNVFGLGLEPLKEESYEVKDDNGNVIASWTSVHEDRVESDPSLAEGCISNDVCTLTVGEWKLTVDEFLIDENGIGAMMVTVSNPGGLDSAVPQDAEWENGIPVSFYLTDYTGRLVDSYDFVVESTRTETSLQEAVYFTPFDSTSVDMKYTLNAYAYSANATAGGWCEITDIARKLTCTDMTSDSVISASASPVGIMLKAVNTKGDYAELIPNKIEIVYTDGSSYVVEDDDANIMNTRCSSTSNTDSAVYVWTAFNRLVDVDKIESINFTGTFDHVAISTDLTK